MIPVKLHEWEDAALRPYCNRPRGGFVSFTPQQLVDKINAVPDVTHEKAWLIHYWGRLCLACSNQNSEAIEGWLTALALATHTAGFILPLAKPEMSRRKKLRSTVQPKSGAALKEKSDSKMNLLRQAVKDYLIRKPKGLNHGATACRDALQARGELLYSKSYGLKKVCEIFDDLRHQRDDSKKA